MGLAEPAIVLLYHVDCLIIFLSECSEWAGKGRIGDEEREMSTQPPLIHDRGAGPGTGGWADAGAGRGGR